MSFEESLSWFYENPWVTFIGSVGLLLMTFLAVKETVNWLRNSTKKPSLIFRTSMVHETIEKQKGVFYTKVNFWISVTNNGKKEAHNCHAFLKFTDEKFKENLVWKSSLPQCSVNEPFGVSWYFLDTKKDVIDIPITNKSGYGIKIPFYMELLQTQNNSDWKFGDIMGWEHPVKELYFEKVDFPEQHDLYEHVLGVIVEVFYGNNKNIKKNFLIKVPHNRKTEHFKNDPWSIEFFEVHE